jgi:putative hydrolase of the HAD superfamily
MAPVRAVLLDAMGTVLELERPAPRLRDALRERLGVRVGEAEAEDAMRAEIAFYRAHHLEGADAAGLLALRRRCAEVVRDRLPALASASTDYVLEALLAALRFRAHSDAAPALRTLRTAGVKLVAVSNWDVSLGAALEQAGLAALLDGAISSAEAGADKPRPEIFARALALAGDVEPAEALHVGDRLEEDVAGARAAGIRPVLLARGVPAPAGIEAIDSLAELPALALAQGPPRPRRPGLPPDRPT